MIFNKYEDFGKTLTVLIVKVIGKNDQACAHLSKKHGIFYKIKEYYRCHTENLHEQFMLHGLIQTDIRLHGMRTWDVFVRVFCLMA